MVVSQVLGYDSGSIVKHIKDETLEDLLEYTSKYENFIIVEE